MRIGIDLGGTKIEGIVLRDDGAIAARRRIATPSNYEAIGLAIRDLVGQLEAEAGPCRSVGIGTPGAISPATGLMKNSNTVCLNGRPLDVDLARWLGRPVRLANDANCFALSEAKDGAAADASVVFGVIVGTGTGAGIVVRDALLTGQNAIAGEWGHFPLPWPTDDERPGPQCYCGKRGCVETWLSGPALGRDHRLHTGQALDARAIGDRADAGDAAALETLARYVDRMGRSLAVVIDVLDPDVIVLGGGVGNIRWLYQALPTVLPRWVFSDAVATRVVPPMHGDSSGVRGAAWLWD